MISLILTGHGRIASGLTEAITQIFGPQAAVFYIDFPEGMSTTDLEKELTQVMADCPDDIVFLTDLLGGSPFRIASTLAQVRSGVEVIAGMNLSMFAEMLFERDEITNPMQFRERTVEAGRNGITSLADRLNRQQRPKEQSDGL